MLAWRTICGSGAHLTVTILEKVVYSLPHTFVAKKSMGSARRWEEHKCQIFEKVKGFTFGQRCSYGGWDLAWQGSTAFRRRFRLRAEFLFHFQRPIALDARTTES